MTGHKWSSLGWPSGVKKNGADAARYDKLTGKDGSPYFTLKATNGQVIGQSQMYSSEATRDNGIQSCVNHAPGASVSDLSAQA